MNEKTSPYLIGEKEREIEDLKRLLVTTFLKLVKRLDPELADYLYKTTEKTCIEHPGYQDQPTPEAKADFLSMCIAELLSQTILDAVYDYTNFEKVREQLRKSRGEA